MRTGILAVSPTFQTLQLLSGANVNKFRIIYVFYGPSKVNIVKCYIRTDISPGSH